MRSDPAELHPLGPWLRWRVAEVRAGTRRRIFPAVVEVVPSAGMPGSAATAAWEYGGEAGDHALRVDVLVRLLSGRAGPLTVVHVRPGWHDCTDPDMGWAAAGRVAGDIAQV
ncbi:MAG: hypothetical protein GEU93_20350, partial [Propionibacteriales bacterium]|nr:hypothetical protein [Propionibacteriales bacterium]